MSAYDRNIKYIILIIMALLLGLVGWNVYHSIKNIETFAQNLIVPKDFYGAGYVDTGDGLFYIVKDNETSQNGNIIKFNIKKSSSSMRLNYRTEEIEHAKCTVYIDGKKNCDLIVDGTAKGAITLIDNNLTPGIHTIEIVAIENKVVIAYKIAQYEIEGE